jgi:hypothetical protein
VVIAFNIPEAPVCVSPRNIFALQTSSLKMTLLLHFSRSVYPFKNHNNAKSIIGLKKRLPESGLTVFGLTDGCFKLTIPF